MVFFEWPINNRGMCNVTTRLFLFFGTTLETKTTWDDECYRIEKAAAQHKDYHGV